MNSNANTTQVVFQLNGESTQKPVGSTIADLIIDLGVSGRYAVEINGQVVPRTRHTEYKIVAGDKVEVVQAIGGG